MPRRRRDYPVRRAVLAGARLLAWLADLGAILIMGYIIKCWPGNGAAVSAGIVGAAIAMLNDSWEMVAHTDPTGNFIPLAPPRVVLHDLFSMGVTMGGLILLLFADIREQRSEHSTEPFDYDSTKKREFFSIAQWFLAAIVVLRFIFAIWSGCNCTGISSPRHRWVRNREQ